MRCGKYKNILIERMNYLSYLIYMNSKIKIEVTRVNL